MNLAELSDPLFKYVCFLNRSARRGAHIDPEQADGELETILSEMRSKAGSTPGMADQYEKMELPLICFADNVIAGSPFSFAEAYQRLAYKRGCYTGDTEFCVELDKALAEPETASSTDRLALFYTCIGLGFTGDKLEDPEERRKKMAQLARRIRPLLEGEDRARITPQAYKYTLEEDLIPPPVGPVWTIGIALAGFILAVIVSMAFLYQHDTQQMNATLQTIAGSQK